MATKIKNKPGNSPPTARPARRILQIDETRGRNQGRRWLKNEGTAKSRAESYRSSAGYRFQEEVAVGRSLVVVAALVVKHDVEAFGLFVFVHPQPDDRIDDLQDDER